MHQRRRPKSWRMSLRMIHQSCDLAQPQVSSVRRQSSAIPSPVFTTARSGSDWFTVIPETEGDEEYEDDFGNPVSGGEDSEVGALRTALEECWTLCNTLANL